MIKRHTERDYEGSENLLAAEKELILKAYKLFNGHRVKMAEALGITDRSLYDRMRAHGIEGLINNV